MLEREGVYLAGMTVFPFRDGFNRTTCSGRVAKQCFENIDFVWMGERRKGNR